MKQKITVTLLDMPFSIVSDEDEERVHALAKTLSERVQNVLWKSRVSRTEAALFCALEDLSDAENAKQRADKAEAQLSLYTANLARMREENERLSKRLDQLEAQRKS